MQVYYSNKVEKLFEGLKARLFAANTTPFTKRYIIVPSPAMKNWLTKAMAEDSDLGIAAGIYITYLEPAVRELISKLSSEPELFPKNVSELELAIRLEIEMKKVLEMYPRMGYDERALWNPLVIYIISKSEIPKSYPLKNKEARRILNLSSKLASLFVTYGKFGSEMLRQWKEEFPKAGEWQKALWKRCVNEVSPKDYEWKSQNCTIHLFGVSFIPQQHHQLFLSLSKVISVHYYLLSPCQVFWSETLSDRECRSLIKFWEKREAAEVQQLALEEYIYDRNPLLANLGRVGREMALQIESTDCITQEIYEIPENFNEIDEYHELISDEIDFSKFKPKISMLESLQADLMLMRKPTQESKIHFQDDQSIQLHMSSSPMREIQTLYDVLVGIIQTHAHDEEPIRPEDIIVMAPDIIKYEPFIKSVFSEQESKLDFQMMDLNILSRHPLIQGFLLLLDLSYSRWDVSSILELFENSVFQQRQGFSIEDIQKIKGWIEAADVRWGEDPEHRREVLKRDFDESCEVDGNPSGTWKKGIERLFLGLAMLLPEDDVKDEMQIFPLNHVDGSQTVLFGQWIQLMRSLRDDLQPLIDGSSFSLGEWSAYLKCLLDVYFVNFKQNEANSEEARTLLEMIDSLSLDRKYEKEKFSFSTIKYHIEQYLNKQRIGYRESHLHSVRFCSMLPMRALPAKVVVLLGMSEDNYPRRDATDSLNLLKRGSGSDYSPSQSEFDRYLFLETILSARQYYVLSYTGYSKADGKEQSPSLLIAELFNYLDRAFVVDGKQPSEICLKKYPFYSYDKALFEEGTTMQSYSEMYYRAAKVYYGEKIKESQHSFISKFVSREKTKLDFQENLDLKRIVQMARNPIEAFMKNRLGMYLKESEDGSKRNEEDFILDAMQNAILRNNSFKRSFDSILQSADKEGRLPLGPFRNYSIGKLRTEVVTIKQNFESLGIEPEGVFELHLSENNTEPKKCENGNWELPALICTYNGNPIKIVGKLSNISNAGMISTGGDERSDIPRIWPTYLAFLCIVKQFDLAFDKKLIFAKSGKTKNPFFEDPIPLFERYLVYYFHSLENISPLIPEWIPDILKNDCAKFEEKMQSTLSDRNQHFYNNYFKWILRGSKNPDPEVIMNNWRHIAEDLYGEMYSHWYPTKKAANEVPV